MTGSRRDVSKVAINIVLIVLLFCLTALPAGLAVLTEFAK